MGLKTRGLETGIWASRLGFEGGGGGEGMEEKKEEKEKIPHMCESIGHRPLRGRCPKGDRPTDRWTDEHMEGRTDQAGCSHVARD